MRKNKDENDTVSANEIKVFDENDTVLKIEIVYWTLETGVLNFEFNVSKMKINCFEFWICCFENENQLF